MPVVLATSYAFNKHACMLAPSRSLRCKSRTGALSASTLSRCSAQNVHCTFPIPSACSSQLEACAVFTGPRQAASHSARGPRDLRLQHCNGPLERAPAAAAADCCGQSAAHRPPRCPRSAGHCHGCHLRLSLPRDGKPSPLHHMTDDCQLHAHPCCCCVQLQACSLPGPCIDRQLCHCLCRLSMALKHVLLSSS